MAPVVLKVIFGVRAVLIHKVWSAELTGVMVLFGVTMIVPVAVTAGVVHPPVKVTVYVYVPAAVGVPLMVTTFDDHAPLTPPGKPLKVAPVAPVVAKVIFGVRAVLMHTVWLAELTGTMVLFGVTLIMPLAITVPQPPVKVIT